MQCCFCSQNRRASEKLCDDSSSLRFSDNISGKEKLKHSRVLEKKCTCFLITFPFLLESSDEGPLVPIFQNLNWPLQTQVLTGVHVSGQNLCVRPLPAFQPRVLDVLLQGVTATPSDFTSEEAFEGGY